MPCWSLAHLITEVGHCIYHKCKALSQLHQLSATASAACRRQSPPASRWLRTPRARRRACGTRAAWRWVSLLTLHAAVCLQFGVLLAISVILREDGSMSRMRDVCVSS